MEMVNERLRVKAFGVCSGAVEGEGAVGNSSRTLSCDWTMPFAIPFSHLPRSLTSHLLAHCRFKDHSLPAPWKPLLTLFLHVGTGNQSSPYPRSSPLDATPTCSGSSSTLAHVEENMNNTVQKSSLYPVNSLNAVQHPTILTHALSCTIRLLSLMARSPQTFPSCAALQQLLRRLGHGSDPVSSFFFHSCLPYHLLSLDFASKACWRSGRGLWV